MICWKRELFLPRLLRFGSLAGITGVETPATYLGTPEKLRRGAKGERGREEYWYCLTFLELQLTFSGTDDLEFVWDVLAVATFTMRSVGAPVVPIFAGIF